MKYWAFISYGHGTARVATKFHSALEAYRIPPSLVGQPGISERVPPNLKPVFLDRKEFRGGPDLFQEIAPALENSRSLIVLCSPSAAASEWVDQEIRYFQAIGRQDRIFAVIVDAGPRGVTTDAIPLALRRRKNPDGSISELEPLAADLKNDGFRNAALKVIAGILGVDFDALKRRDQIRRRRRRVAAVVLGIVMTIASVMAIDAKVLPGDGLRRIFDRYDASMFRRAPASQLDRLASEARRSLIPTELSEIEKPDFILKDATDDHAGGVWELGQLLAGIAGAPETSPGALKKAESWMNFPFQSNQPVVANGILYGWMSYKREHPQAEAALWPVIAISAFLARPGALMPDERKVYLDYLRLAQRAASLYYADGGWMHLPNQTDRQLFPVYTCIVGLEALLAVRAIHEEWPDHDLDKMISATATRLIRTYDDQDERRDDPGWHGAQDHRDLKPNQSLTLFAYSALLRAAALQPDNVRLSERMLSDIQRRVRDFPVGVEPIDTDQEHVQTEFRDTDGVIKQEPYDWKFARLSYAIACTEAWLDRLQSMRADNADVVAARRALITVMRLIPKMNESRGDFYRAEGVWILDRIR